MVPASGCRRKTLAPRKFPYTSLECPFEGLSKEGSRGAGDEIPG
jgi:hypothetical protein